MWNLGEGEAAKPWYDSIPEESVREHIKSKAYANPNELAMANYSLTKMQRGDGTVITRPGPDADEGTWNEFHKSMGRPDTADAYDFKFEDGFQPDETMLKFGKDLFHQMGLSNEAAQRSAKTWNDFVVEQNTAAETKRVDDNAADLDALVVEWGADLDANKAAGQRVVASLGMSDDDMAKLDGAMGTATVVRLLASIGRKSDEGGFTAGSQNGDPNDPSTMTKEQAQAKISALGSDAEFQKAYTDNKHPGHLDAVKRMEALYARS
jgi:hypothetical protein